VVALGIVNAGRVNFVQDRFAFHKLGYALDVEAAGERRYAGDDLPHHRAVRGHVPDELAVHLDIVDGEVLEILERGIAGPKSSMANRKPQLERVDEGLEQPHVLDRVPLGDLEDHVSRIDAVIAEQARTVGMNSLMTMALGEGSGTACQYTSSPSP